MAQKPRENAARKVWTPDEIRALRDSLEFTQDAMAGELGINTETVRRWEQGRSKPSTLARRALDGLEK